MRPWMRVRGRSSARAAASRNFAANIELAPSCRSSRRSISSGSGMISSGDGGWSVSGKRMMKPSSLHIDSTSMASCWRTFAATTIAHGA